MHKFKHGNLHSGSKGGKKVHNRQQAIAIMLSEKRKADEGDEEYEPDSEPDDDADDGESSDSIGPSFGMKRKMMKKRGMK